MPYKPKYCCQCGEKIDRVEWKPWTSRRFCDLCATDFGIYDKIRAVLLGIGLLFGLYAIGSHFQKTDKHLTIVPSQAIISTPLKDAVIPGNSAQVSKNVSVPLTAQSKNLNAAPASELKKKQFELPVAETPEKVYFCGAQTKKGAMCSRRVKNGGRCWQHEGQQAMLPQDKLIIAN